MQLQVTHETVYDYAPAVETAQHMAYLRPLHTPFQSVLAHTLTICPTPEKISQMRDVFGNTRSFFSLQTPHRQLRIVAQSVVSTRAQSMPESRIAWAATRELFRYQSGAEFDAASEFVFPSPFCPRHADFFAYAQASFAPGVGVLAGASDLMRRMYADFRYESHSTEINTPALYALAQRKGVCQDFAHIMIACLRAMGIPARYVSGYLLTQPPPGTVKLRGSDASHAWCSVYVPDLPEGQRWCDLDPTNNRGGWHSPGDDYVTLAIGRDFSDVSPLRGVIHGGSSHTLTVGVTVEAAASDETGGGPDSPLANGRSQSTENSRQMLSNL